MCAKKLVSWWLMLQPCVLLLRTHWERPTIAHHRAFGMCWHKKLIVFKPQAFSNNNSAHCHQWNKVLHLFKCVQSFALADFPPLSNSSFALTLLQFLPLTLLFLLLFCISDFNLLSVWSTLEPVLCHANAAVWETPNLTVFHLSLRLRRISTKHQSTTIGFFVSTCPCFIWSIYPAFRFFVFFSPDFLLNLYFLNSL